MNTTQKNIYELIEDYLNDDLPLQEKKLFDQRLKRDKKLQAVVQQYKMILIGLKHNARLENLKKLKEFEDTLPKIDMSIESNFKVSSKRYLIATAAGILIALLTTFIIYQNYSIHSTIDKIYASYYKPYPNIVHAITRGDNNDESIEKKAYHAYEQGHYRDAIDLFYKLPEKKFNGAALFYIGSSYLAMDEPHKAIEHFNLSLSKHRDFSIQTNWYLGLAYLKANQPENAQRIFEKIVELNNSYTVHAKEILGRMKAELPMIN